MKSHRHSVATLFGFELALLFVALAASSTRAAVTYEQPPSASVALHQSSEMTPNNSDWDQRIWESFVLPATETIREIQWRGGFIYNGYGEPVVDFEISIYTSIPAGSEPWLGAPPLVTWHTNNNANQTAVGNGSFDYRFTLPTPFTATGGTKYWLRLVAKQAGIPDWGWADASGGNGSHFRSIAGMADAYYQIISGDCAFSLLTHATAPAVITVSASPVAGGTVSGGGTYPLGTSVTVTAAPAAGYSFLGWSEGGTIVSTALSYTFTATANRTLAATFSNGGNGPFTITATAFPAIAGNVGGAGTYAKGEKVDLDASATDGFLFNNWTESGVIVSTSATYSFTATANRNLVANFRGTGSTCIVSANPAPFTAGTITGAGAYFRYQIATVTATPAAGYSFRHWEMNGGIVSASPSYTFTVMGDTAFTAHFGTAVTISASATTGGSVAGTGSYFTGDDVTVDATPAPGYVFMSWTESGAPVSIESS